MRSLLNQILVDSLVKEAMTKLAGPDMLSTYKDPTSGTPGHEWINTPEGKAQRQRNWERAWRNYYDTRTSRRTGGGSAYGVDQSLYSMSWEDARRTIARQVQNDTIREYNRTHMKKPQKATVTVGQRNPKTGKTEFVDNTAAINRRTGDMKLKGKWQYRGSQADEGQAIAQSGAKALQQHQAAGTPPPDPVVQNYQAKPGQAATGGSPETNAAFDKALAQYKQAPAQPQTPVQPTTPAQPSTQQAQVANAPVLSNQITMSNFDPSIFNNGGAATNAWNGQGMPNMPPQMMAQLTGLFGANGLGNFGNNASAGNLTSTSVNNHSALYNYTKQVAGINNTLQDMYNPVKMLWNGGKQLFS